MSWGAGTVIGSTQNKTANQTDLTVTLSSGCSVGDLLVLILAKDNATTVDGDPLSSDIITVSGSVSGLGSGGSWRAGVNWVNGGTVQTTTMLAVWYIQSTLAFAASDTVTASFGGTTTANDAQCAILVKFSPSAGSLVYRVANTAQSDDGVDPTDITLGSLTSAEYLWLWCLAAEGPDSDAYTIDSDYTAITGTGTTGGLDTSNQHVRAAYRVMTGTTDTVATVSTTADRDYAQALMVFKEVAFGSSSGGPVQLVNSDGLVG